jgi:hypothetical protein
MLNLNNITIIGINGIDPINSCKAIQYSCKNIFFKRNILITNQDMNYDGIECINVGDKISGYYNYNKFYLYELHKYFETDHCLLVHPDGFVINHNLWDPEYLNYDYIGAPWAPSHDFPHRVGNGGFSIRSKRLLESLSSVIDPNTFPQDAPEDHYICRIHNKQLESMGFKFAPLNLAAKFSIEWIPTDIIYYYMPYSSFGFHGKSYPQNEEYINLLNTLN